MLFGKHPILDEIAVISLESVKKSPDSNVRFCLRAGLLHESPLSFIRKNEPGQCIRPGLQARRLALPPIVLRQV